MSTKILWHLAAQWQWQSTCRPLLNPLHSHGQARAWDDLGHNQPARLIISMIMTITMIIMIRVIMMITDHLLMKMQICNKMVSAAVLIILIVFNILMRKKSERVVNHRRERIEKIGYYSCISSKMSNFRWEYVFRENLNTLNPSWLLTMAMCRIVEDSSSPSIIFCILFFISTLTTSKLS